MPVGGAGLQSVSLEHRQNPSTHMPIVIGVGCGQSAFVVQRAPPWSAMQVRTSFKSTTFTRPPLYFRSKSELTTYSQRESDEIAAEIG